MRRSSLCAAFAAAALAAPALADRVVITNSGPGYGGGAFNARVTVEDNTDSFYAHLAHGSTVMLTTFCLEVQEHFYSNRSYYVDWDYSAANGGGTAGGASGSPLRDPISSSTAYLMSMAHAGTLVFNIGSGNVTLSLTNNSHQRALQEAIWSLENESWSGYSGASSTVGRIRANLIARANANNNGSLYNVAVMRLWQNRSGNSETGFTFSGYAQDQLAIIPLNLTVVPLPPAAWAGLATLGVAALARRRVNRRG